MKRVGWMVSLFSVLFMAALATPASFAVSYGTALVDGNYGEWSDSDLYAPMHRAGNPSKAVESNLYLKYDCASQTLFALVLTVDGVPALTLPNDAYVKIDGPNALVNGSVTADGVTPDFAWVGLSPNGDTSRGWEASVSLAPGSHTISVHVQVFDDGASQTSSTTAGSSNDRYIPLFVECGANNGLPDEEIPVPLYSVSGVSFVDSNGNGAFDSGEEVLPGVDVTLLNEGGASMAVSSGNDSGAFAFADLPAGNYAAAAPSLVTVDGQDYQLTSSNPLSFALSADRSDLGFAFIPVYDIRGNAFVDDNRSGIPESGESALPGVTVTLSDAQGLVLATAITDANGAYLFENLPGGFYKVSVPASFTDGVFEYVPTTAILVTLGLGEDTVLHFGYIPVFDIGGTAFLDADRDGQLDGFEIGFPYYTVNLLNENGEILASVVPDDSGAYLFENWPRGNYSVQVIPSGDGFSVYFQPTTVTIHAVALQQSDSLENDFGFAPDTAAILTDFNSGDPDGDGVVFHGTGKTIGFWKHQLTTALQGKGSAQVAPGTLQGYLDTVETLVLAQPYQFNDANEFGSALEILSSTSSVPVNLLLKQLLATELNDVSDRGLNEPYRALQEALIAWGESLAVDPNQSASALLTAKDIFDAINNSGE